MADNKQNTQQSTGTNQNFDSNAESTQRLADALSQLSEDSFSVHDALKDMMEDLQSQTVPLRENIGLVRELQRSHADILNSLDAESLSRKDLNKILLDAEKNLNKVKNAKIRLAQEYGNGDIDKAKEELEQKIREKKQERGLAEDISTYRKLTREIKECTGALDMLNVGEEAAIQLRDKAQENLNIYDKNRGFIGALGDTLDELGISNRLKDLTLWGAALGIAKKLFNEIRDAFREVDKAAANFKREVGQWGYTLATSNQGLATAVQWLETATGLAKDLGIDVTAAFSSQTIADVAEFKNLTGATADQANKLAIAAKLTGQSTDQWRDNLAKGANEGNRANRSIVTMKAAQDAVLNSSNAILLSYSGSADKLGEAAVAAKNLGMELRDIEKIQSSLIHFESSISAEMEAQLLTGHQLNLSKARSYALNNDLKGVAEEIARQGVTAFEFGKMNVIQQESMAKALGMSRDELAKSLILRQLNNGVSAEALANAMNMTKEQIEGMSAADKWKTAVDQLKQSFAPILGILAKIVGKVAEVISKLSSSGIGKVALTLTGLAAAGLGAVKVLGKLGGVVKGLGTGGRLAGLGAGFKAMGKGLSMGLGTLAKGAGGALIGAGVLAGIAAILGAGVAAAIELPALALNRLGISLERLQNLDYNKLRQLGGVLGSIGAGAASMQIGAVNRAAVSINRVGTALSDADTKAHTAELERIINGAADRIVNTIGSIDIDWDWAKFDSKYREYISTKVS